MLMKPGLTAFWVASRITGASARDRSPMYAMVSCRMPTSARTPGVPEPSYTVPPRMMTSNEAGGVWAEQAVRPRIKRELKNLMRWQITQNPVTARKRAPDFRSPRNFHLILYLCPRLWTIGPGTWLRISMDRISDSDSEDAGSIPAGATYLIGFKPVQFSRCWFPARVTQSGGYSYRDYKTKSHLSVALVFLLPAAAA